MFRVAYGDGDLEFMLQPWFEVATGSGPFDIVVAGIGGPDDADIARALRAAQRLRPLVRDGGALVIAAQLADGEGDDPHQPDVFVAVAASEAPEAVRLAGMRAAVDVEEGLDLAYEHIGRPARASVLVVPRVSRA